MSVSMRSETVKGKRISYREHNDGRESSPIVFLIHGNTASGLWFDQVMEIEGVHTCAPDMPNFGNSDPIEESDIDLYAEYMAGLVDSVVADRRLVIVGHSLGGAVAMSLALRAPYRVAGLMLVDSCAPEGLVTAEEYYPVIEQYKTDRELLKNALSAVTPHLRDRSLLEALVDEALRMNPSSFSGNARALAKFNCAKRTKELAAPVLVLRGSDDVLISEEMARHTAEAFPNGSLVTVEDVGHSIMVEAPRRFVALLRQFVDQIMG